MVKELADTIAQGAIVVEVILAGALADWAYNVDLLQDDLVVVIYYLKLLLSFGPPAIISGRRTFC